MSSCVESGLALESFTSAPASRRESTRTEVSFVTCRHTPTVTPLRGLAFACFEAMLERAVIWPLAQRKFFSPSSARSGFAIFPMRFGPPFGIGLLSSSRQVVVSLLFGGVLDDGEDVVALQRLPSLQSGKLDDEREPDHLSSQHFDQLRSGEGRASRRDEVVDDKDPFPPFDRVHVDLE